MASQTGSGIELHLHDSASGEHAVHASVLVRVLGGLQDALNSLAQDARTDPTSKRARARFSAKLAEEYSLVCGVPREGSYSLPLSLLRSDLLAEIREKEITNDLVGLVKGIETGDVERVRNMFRHNVYRHSALEAVKRASPDSTETWHTEIRIDSHSMSLDQNTQVRIIDLESKLIGGEKDATTVVVGVLEVIDFGNTEAVIRYPETGKRLRFRYDETVEVLLLKNVRKLVEVRADIQVDSDGQPTRIDNVSNIQEVDMTPIVLDRIPIDSGSLVLRNPLVLTLTESDPTHLLRLEHPPLDIDVFARTRDELLEELNEQVVMLWIEYAKEDDRNLTASSRDLKQKLLVAIEEVPGAPSEK
jgi:hypothetical protein